MLLRLSIIIFFSFFVIVGAHAERKEITADHSKFEELQKNFKDGNEITKACLECHNKASDQLKTTLHWTWHVADDDNLGKAGLSLNNFCISPNMLGDKSCLDCHIGWDGKEKEVNCLVCHAAKELNWKETLNDIASLEEEGDEDSLELVEELRDELNESILSVGQPGIQNCGSCHFYGGGGDAVKRGDLDTSLLTASRELDVHMSKDGANMTCLDCHQTANHQLEGREYNMSAEEKWKSLGRHKYSSFLGCEKCHTAAPHVKEQQLNDHTEFLACQTCHIPLNARGKHTKVWWDWSKAGKLKDGQPYNDHDEFGNKTYMSIKGEFRWEKDIVPTYAWYDGHMKHLTFNDVIDPSTTVDLQVPKGPPARGTHKIHPFKLHLGNQPYDTEQNKLVAPLLSGDDGYWTKFDWDLALSEGMAKMNLPFSGKYGFVKTRFMYPLNHTIAPKEDALGCDDCHNREDSRMKGLTISYVPGRGDFSMFTRFAWIMLGLMVIGAVFHAGTRIYFKLKKRRDSNDG